MAFLLWSTIVLAIGGLAATTIIDTMCATKTTGSVTGYEYTPDPSKDFSGITLDPVPKFHLSGDCATPKKVTECSFALAPRNTRFTSDSGRFNLKDKTSQTQKSCYFHCTDETTGNPRLLCIPA